MTEDDIKIDNAFDTIPKLMLYHSKQRGQSPANRQKEYGIWKSWTWAEVADEVRSLACGLASLGFQKGDKLAELHLIESDNVIIKEVYSGKDIDKISRFYRSFSIINYLLFGVSHTDK